jgi:hypothetical protein
MCNRLAIVFKIKTMKTKTMKKQKRENNSKLFTKTEMQNGENIRELYKHSMLHHGLNTDNDEFRLSFFFFSPSFPHWMTKLFFMFTQQ